MKIFVSQQNYHIGNFESNVKKIIRDIQLAEEANGDMIVFAELSICGYPPRDFLEFDEFLQKCNEAIDLIKEHTSNIGVLVGAPAKNPQPEGKNLFNAAYFLYQNEVKQVIHKALLPNYDIFDEYRYFEPGFEFKCIDFKGEKIAVTICEDIWDIEDDPIYRFRPMDILIQENPSLMINLSASPFNYNHAENRKYTIKKNCERYQLPMIYCNCVGSQTEIVFDGGSIASNKDGSIIMEGAYFEEDLQSVTFENGILLGDSMGQLPNIPSLYDTLDPNKNIDRIHQALIIGIREYFDKMGFKNAIVASSGGIDSAVVLALACEALGSDSVHALLLPSQYSSGHSVDDAVQLSTNLNNKYDIISIKNIYDSIEDSLSTIFANLPFDVTEENIQSRIRGLLVMALSNKFNYILLNTSNKSELSTGYGTLYGDMAGGIGILGDLYKTQVYALAKYINRNGEIIPNNIISKAPSAELRPDQKDQDTLPEYDVLDAILYQYIEQRKGIEDITQMGFEKTLVTKVLTMMNRNEYKRNQFCPIIRVSNKSFGIGRRIPIVAKYEI